MQVCVPHPTRVCRPAALLVAATLWILTWFALAGPSPARAATAQAHVPWAGDARFWLDDSGKASVAQAFERFRQGGHFQTKEGVKGANFGFFAGAAWMVLPLPATTVQDNEAQGGWVLTLDYPPLDDLHLYVLDANGQVLSDQRSGDAMPFWQRALPLRAHAFEFSLRPEPSLLLLRVSTSGVLSMPVAVQKEADFLRWLVTSYAVYAFYFGLVLGLVAYNAIMGVQLRDVGYAWYGLFGCSVAGLQASLSGMGMQYLWPNALWWQSKSAAVFIALACWFGLQFTRHFLSTRAMPRLDLAARVLMAVSATALLAALVLPLSVSTHINSSVAAISVVYIVAAAVQAIRFGVPNAKNFLLAWGVLLLGAVALLLHNNALIATNLLTRHGLLVGSAIEMVMLSLCLGDTVRRAQRERELAFVRANEEHELVESLRASQKANEALLAQREATLNNAVVGMVVSVNRQHTWINDKFVQMMGYERHEMLGRTSQYLYANPDDWERFGPESVAQLKAHGSVSSELRLRRKDGTLMWAHMAGALVKPGVFEEGVIWTVLDVTALRDAEEQTRSAFAEQRELNEARERFVAMTSHELRTPVASILGTLELFEHYGERLSETEKADMLKQINAAAQRLWGMTERVLLHGKAQAGQLAFHPQRVALQPLLQDIVAELCMATQHPRERLVTHWPDGQDTLRLDPALLRHMLNNLIGNAYKYSPETAPVQLKVWLDGTSLCLEVRDQGIGIPKEDLPRVFQGFRRAGNVGEISGTGLGLSIVKHCVQIHGGTVQVESEPHQGTTFTVHLPVA